MTRLNEDLSVVIDNALGLLRIYYRGEPLLEQQLNLGLVSRLFAPNGDLDMKSLENLLKDSASNESESDD